MSRYSNCRICKASYHWCISCGLTEDESAPYDNGVCDKCFEASGAQASWLKLYQVKRQLEDEVDRKLEEFARNPHDPAYTTKETKE